jgi:serine/threonine-protein kinase RsbW
MDKPDPVPSGVAAEPVKLRLKNSLNELSRLTGSVSEYLQQFELAPDAQADVTLILEELFINIVRHGYIDAGEHYVAIEVGVKGSEVAMMVEDTGVPFNPLEMPAPDTTLPVADRQVGGLGIHIVLALTDSFTYERREGLNRVVMTKRVPRV